GVQFKDFDSFYGARTFEAGRRKKGTATYNSSKERNRIAEPNVDGNRCAKGNRKAEGTTKTHSEANTQTDPQKDSAGESHQIIGAPQIESAKGHRRPNRRK